MERDNGLEAETFAFLGTVRASRSDELLADLAAEGIAAYAVSGEPDDRLYVDDGSLGYAEALLRRSGASGTDDDTDSTDDTDDAGDERAGDAGEDAAWERIVADFDRDDDPDEDRPWPDAEDVEDDERDAGDDSAGTAEDTDDDEPRTVGKNRAKVSVIRIDTDAEDTQADEEEHYVKPEPPKLKGDVWTRSAWLVMLAALAYPIAGIVLHWDMPGWSIALAVVAFIAGVVTHVVRLRDSGTDDGPDDGAVV